MMRRGEVWWVRFDPSLGSETYKTRPAVIISNDALNRSLPRVLVVPLTSKIRKLYQGEVLVRAGGSMSRAMISQIRAVDKARVGRYFGALSEVDLAALEQAVKKQFEQ